MVVREETKVSPFRSIQRAAGIYTPRGKHKENA